MSYHTGLNVLSTIMKEAKANLIVYNQLHDDTIYRFIFVRIFFFFLETITCANEELMKMALTFMKHTLVLKVIT